jgi:S-methylmethionine-dependent homocysteine/selenocysteine methylase
VDAWSSRHATHHRLLLRLVRFPTSLSLSLSWSAAEGWKWNRWEAGARVLGGCCGTGPADMAALRTLLTAHIHRTDQ